MKVLAYRRPITALTWGGAYTAINNVPNAVNHLPLLAQLGFHLIFHIVYADPTAYADRTQ